jgi:hypothetical protein
MPDLRRVRVTMLPDPIEVPEDEIPVLRAQGLLVEDDEARPAVAVATTKTVKKEGSA